MPRLLANRGELERIAAQLQGAKYLLEFDLLVNLVTHPLRNLIIEIELISIIGDIDKLIQVCRVANENYFQGEAQIDASHDQLLSLFSKMEHNLGAALTGGTALLAANGLALMGVGGSSQGSAKLIDSFEAGSLRNSLPSLISRLKPLGLGDVARVRIESQNLNGHRQFTVLIPGTQAWLPIAGKNPLDLNSTLRSLAGDKNTAAANAVQSAMKQAGIGTFPGDRVTLVGHSLGGVIANQIAQKSEGGKLGFAVSGVVTFGSPNSSIKISESIPAINLEHTDDLAVYADGQSPSDSENHKTLVAGSPQIRLESTTPFGSHDLSVYRHTAQEYSAMAAQGEGSPQLSKLIEQLETTGQPGERKVQIFELERLG